MKKTKKIATTIDDIPATGFVLAHDELGQVVGGMKCRDDWKEVSTATLNSNGNSDTQTDCTK